MSQALPGIAQPVLYPKTEQALRATSIFSLINVAAALGAAPISARLALIRATKASRASIMAASAFFPAIRAPGLFGG